MRVEKRVLNDALRVLGKVVCQTSPIELYRSPWFAPDRLIQLNITQETGIESVYGKKRQRMLPF